MLRTINYGPPHFRENLAELYRNRQKFYALLNHLKSRRFIENGKKDKKSIWKITKRGLEKLRILENRNLYARSSASYKSAAGTSFKIIACDIPASEPFRKRNWLRSALANLGFRMLQKSVWIGKKAVPEEFLENLQKRDLLKHVHILEVSGAEL